MITVEEARRRILDAVKPLAALPLPIIEAWGCVLATDIRAPHEIPTFASSAMDGYAVRSSDVQGASPVTPVALKKVGEAPIGHPTRAVVGAGEAVWIATGAPIPQGADCIAPIEVCMVEGDQVQVLKEFGPGTYVRPVGQDLKRGELVVPAGRRLFGPELGMLSTVGHGSIPVHPKVRAAVFSTGDELIEPAAPAGEAKVRDANSYTLLGQLHEMGALPRRIGIIPDDEAKLADAFTSFRPEADCFISSGGVSAGERDMVKRVLKAFGTIDTYRVAMQPGMPQAFGLVEGKPFFGLPGNPVSVFVSFELFIRPALLKMMGRTDLDRPEITATMDEEIAGPPDKTRFFRVEVFRVDGSWRARSTGPSASNLLGTAVRAHGLAVVPAGVAAVKPGEEVRVRLFRPPAGWAPDPPGESGSVH